MSMRAIGEVMVVVVSVAAFTSAGCVNLPGPDDEAGTEVSTGKIPAETPFALSGCEETILMFPVDLESAQQALPEGFRAADAQQWLGRPEPTGHSMLVVTMFACEGASLFDGIYDESFVAITVEPPDVGEEQAEAVNLYVLVAATGQAGVAELHERYAWQVYGEQVTLETAHSPVVQASARVADEEGEVISFDTINLLGPLEVQGTYRWWHLSGLGLSLVDYEIDIDTYVGPVSCTVRPGTLVSTVIGTTECDPVDTMGGTNAPFDTSGTWVFIGPMAG